jgi:hypothetical protein
VADAYKTLTAKPEPAPDALSGYPQPLSVAAPTLRAMEVRPVQAMEPRTVRVLEPGRALEIKPTQVMEPRMVHVVEPLYPAGRADLSAPVRLPPVDPAVTRLSQSLQEWSGRASKTQESVKEMEAVQHQFRGQLKSLTDDVETSKSEATQAWQQYWKWSAQSDLMKRQLLEERRSFSLAQDRMVSHLSEADKRMEEVNRHLRQMSAITTHLGAIADWIVPEQGK